MARCALDDSQFPQIAEDILKNVKSAEGKLKEFQEMLESWELKSTIKLSSLIEESKRATVSSVRKAKELREKKATPEESRRVLEREMEDVRQALSDVLNEARRMRDLVNARIWQGERPKFQKTKREEREAKEEKEVESEQGEEDREVVEAAKECGARVSRFVVFVREGGSQGGPDAERFMERVKDMLEGVKRLDSKTKGRAALHSSVDGVKIHVTNAVRQAKCYLFEKKGGFVQCTKDAECADRFLADIRRQCGEGREEQREERKEEKTSMDELATLDQILEDIGEEAPESLAPPAPEKSEREEDEELRSLEGMLESHSSKWDKPFLRQDQFRNKQLQSVQKPSAPLRVSSRTDLSIMAQRLKEKEEELARQEGALCGVCGV